MDVASWNGKVVFKGRRSDYVSSKLFLIYAFQQLVFPGNIQHRCIFNTSQHRIPLTAKSLNYFHLLHSGFFGRSPGDVRQATYGFLGSAGHLKTLRKIDNLRGRRHLTFDCARTRLYSDTLLCRWNTESSIIPFSVSYFSHSHIGCLAGQIRYPSNKLRMIFASCIPSIYCGVIYFEERRLRVTLLQTYYILTTRRSDTTICKRSFRSRVFQ